MKHILSTIWARVCSVLTPRMLLRRTNLATLVGLEHTVHVDHTSLRASWYCCVVPERPVVLSFCTDKGMFVPGEPDIFRCRGPYSCYVKGCLQPTYRYYGLSYHLRTSPRASPTRTFYVCRTICYAYKG